MMIFNGRNLNVIRVKLKNSIPIDGEPLQDLWNIELSAFFVPLSSHNKNKILNL